MKYLILSGILFFSLIAHNSAVANTYSDEDKIYKTLLSQGYNAFQNKNYNGALLYYTKSYQLNDLDSTLNNIAMCHYKLKSWNEAGDAFSQLQDSQSSDLVVSYHLGVINKKQKKHTEALKLFNYISSHSTNEKIALLSDKQIDAIEELITDKNQLNVVVEKGSELNNIFYGSASLGYGFDDDVISVDEGTSGNEGDTFVETVATFGVINNDFKSGAWTLDATYFGTRFTEASEYDLSLMALNSRKHFTITPAIKMYAGAGISKLNLAGEDYTSDINVNVGATYTVGDNKFKIQYKFKHVNADNELYEATAGTSHRYNAYWKHAVVGGHYQLEGLYSADRKNDNYTEASEESEASATIYSKNRFGVTGKRIWQWGKWHLSLAGRYFISDYLPDSASSFADYEKTHYQINSKVELEYELSRHWSINAEVSVTSQDSTDDAYDYDQKSIMTNITYHL